jgi:S1-C subfamily serine protease
MRFHTGFLALMVGVLAGGSQAAPIPPPATPLGAREAADRARTKVVILKIARSGVRSSATGFLVRPGLVVTAAHAVSADASITAWVNGASYPAVVTATHPQHDLAVLTLHAPGLFLKPLALAGSSDDLRPLERLLIIAGPSQGAVTGDPAGRLALEAVYRGKAVLRLSSGRQGVLLRLDASVERGDSGSPVIRLRDGRVVGVLCSRELPDANGLSHQAFAAPVETLAPWLDSLSLLSAPAATQPPAPERYYLEPPVGQQGREGKPPGREHSAGPHPTVAGRTSRSGWKAAAHSGSGPPRTHASTSTPVTALSNTPLR